MSVEKGAQKVAKFLVISFFPSGEKTSTCIYRTHIPQVNFNIEIISTTLWEAERSQVHSFSKDLTN